MPGLRKSMQASRVSIGLVLQQTRRHSCVAGSGCEINSFARRIKRRCDTPAAARPFCSVFEPAFPPRTADATTSKLSDLNNTGLQAGEHTKRPPKPFQRLT